MLVGREFATTDRPSRTQVVTLINRHRKAGGRKVVRRDTALDEVAHVRAVALAAMDRLDGHAGWMPTLRRLRFPWQKRGAGENIAAGFNTAAAVDAAWWASRGHRANVMRREWTHVGVGWHDAADGTRYWATEYAGPN